MILARVVKLTTTSRHVKNRFREYLHEPKVRAHENLAELG